MTVDEMQSGNNAFGMDTVSEVNFERASEILAVFSPTDAVNLSKVLEDYDYDMEMSYNTFFWDELLPTLIVYCLTFVLGLVGNVLIIFTIFRYRKMKSTTNVFLASLASSDLLLILFCIPVKGFQRFVASNGPRSRNKSENLTQTSSDTYRKMKTLLDSFLVKEDEEEAEEEEEEEEEDEEDDGNEILRDPCPCIPNAFGFLSASESTVVADGKGFLLPRSASDKLSLLESNLMRSDTRSDLELLMSKLSEEIRRCSLFIGHLKGAERNCASVKVSASDSRVESSRAWESETNDAGSSCLNGWIREQIVFPVSLRQSRDRVQSLMGDWPGRSKNQIHFKVIPSREHASDDPDSFDLLRANRERSLEKNSGNLRREVSDTSLLSFGNNAAASRGSESESESRSQSQSQSFAESARSRLKTKTGEVLCCDDCKRLKKKIQKLERELEKMERRMPFYPPEYQNSIRKCLESLKVTSDTVLKRLKSYAKLGYLESQGKTYHGEDACNKRPLSAPEAVVRKVANKQLSLRSSHSDYQLRVGMEITMENVDPATGKKLHPEISPDCEQEGNIQCRMFKDDEAPLLVMDTDFSYNPQTGMLFKPKRNSGPSQKQSSDFIVQLRDVRRSLSAISVESPAKSEHSYAAYECIAEKRTVFPQGLFSSGREPLPLSEKSETASHSTEGGDTKKLPTCDESENWDESRNTAPEKRRFVLTESMTKESPLKTHSKIEESKKNEVEKSSERCSSRSALPRNGDSSKERSESDEDGGDRTSKNEKKKKKKSHQKDVNGNRECEREGEKEKVKKNSRNGTRKCGKFGKKPSRSEEENEEDRKRPQCSISRGGDSGAEAERENGNKSRPKNVSESRECPQNARKLEEKKDDKNSRASTSECRDLFKKKNPSESEIATSGPKKSREPVSESTKLEEIATELRKLKEIALDSKKLEECTLDLKKLGRSSQESKEFKKKNNNTDDNENDGDNSSRFCKKKEGKMVSRIPTRRKPTPSSPDPPSRKSSVSSLATTAESSVAECYSSPATSKILFKSSSRTKNENSVCRVFHKKTDEPRFYNKTTQTYGIVEQPSEKCKPKTANVAIQTKCPIKHYGVQTMAKNNEDIQTRSSGLSSETSARSPNHLDASPTPNEFFPLKPMRVNVALQADRGTRNLHTTSVALQTNLPTEESLKYKNDLQVQKKVNMAIAELCFHLSETKERQGV